MNFYDPAQPEQSVPQTRGYRRGRRVCRSVRVYQALVILLGAACAAAVVYDPDDSLSFFGLFLASALSLTLFHYAYHAAAARRILRLGPAAAHDYNYALYRHLSRPQKRDTTLLAIARCDLLLREFDRAAGALALVQPEHLNRLWLRTFYFYQAAAFQCLGQRDDAARALERCRAVPLRRSNKLFSMDALFSLDADADETVLCVSRWTLPVRLDRPLLPLLTGGLLLFTGWYLGVQALLPEGWYYRTGFATVSSLLIWPCWSLLILWWLIRLCRLVFRAQSGRTAIKAFAAVLSAVLWCAASLFCLEQLVVQVLPWDAEYAQLADGLLVMRHYYWLDDDEYYYSQAINPFLRRTLTGAERTAALAQYGDPDPTASEVPETASGSSEAADSADTADTQDAADSLSPEEAEAAAETAEEEELHWSELLAIYQYLSDAGELENPDIDNVVGTYSAKGSLYAIFRSGSDEDGDWQYRLVYDRVSENGQCDLFVYYVDRTDAQGQTSTGILEFYAVDRETLEVIPGEKSGWADPGSQAYRDATGE